MSRAAIDRAADEAATDPNSSGSCCRCSTTMIRPWRGTPRGLWRRSRRGVPCCSPRIAPISRCAPSRSGIRDSTPAAEHLALYARGGGTRCRPARFLPRGHLLGPIEHSFSVALRQDRLLAMPSSRGVARGAARIHGERRRRVSAHGRGLGQTKYIEKTVMPDGHYYLRRLAPSVRPPQPPKISRTRKMQMI